ncbi:MAG: N-acetyltransferase [Sulfitobacter sp.]|nr:N-acetyltransferase [Sulfitobacter sp.]
MTPKQLAALHEAAFRTERPWSASEFQDLLQNPFVALFPHPYGFALSRTVAGETELLTLAVDPAQHRKGIGLLLTQNWLNANADRAETAFLEVASDNLAARSLYERLGFEIVATRAGYYARKNAASADALVMRCPLTFGQPPFSTPHPQQSG